MSRPLSEKMVARLREAAKRETLYDLIVRGDDVNAYECSGGNYDDAWRGGENDGETDLARDILADIGLE